MIAPRNLAAAGQGRAIKFHKRPKLFYPCNPGNLRIKAFEYLNLNHCNFFEIWDLLFEILQHCLVPKLN